MGVASRNVSLEGIQILERRVGEHQYTHGAVRGGILALHPTCRVMSFEGGGKIRRAEQDRHDFPLHVHMFVIVVPLARCGDAVAREYNGRFDIHFAAARIPVARATNLNRTLKDWADRGLQLVGLDAEGDTIVDDVDGRGPIVVVVGSEGKGLSRLVRQSCDAVVSIPMSGVSESLNASVAAGVVLAEIARQRRT